MLQLASHPMLHSSGAIVASVTWNGHVSTKHVLNIERRRIYKYIKDKERIKRKSKHMYKKDNLRDKRKEKLVFM